MGNSHRTISVFCNELLKLERLGLSYSNDCFTVVITKHQMGGTGLIIISYLYADERDKRNQPETYSYCHYPFFREKFHNLGLIVGVIIVISYHTKFKMSSPPASTFLTSV